MQPEEWVEGWIIMNPGDTTRKCPHCGNVGRIKAIHTVHLWLNESVWTCPACDKEITTKQLKG